VGGLSTHSEWHEDHRFRQALLHMLAETTTRTLPSDTYPIRIVPDAVIPGTPFFVTESHSGVLAASSWMVATSIPCRPGSHCSCKSAEVEPTKFLYSKTGVHHLFRFGQIPLARTPERALGVLPIEEYPFYSEEQYTSAFYEGYADYVEAVARRIDPTDYDPSEKVDKIIGTMTHYLQDRVPIVSEGFSQCRNEGCPEGSPLWEIHSTPGRDGMIILWMDHLHQIIDSNHFDQRVMKEKMEAIPFNITAEHVISFYHLYKNYLWLSHHPEDSIEARWGLRKCEMILSQIQSAKNSIGFIERNYRKRDPRYADFAIQQQQEVLRRLHEEWNGLNVKDRKR